MKPPPDLSNRIIGNRTLGKEDWLYDDEFEMHIPCCSYRHQYGRRCGNGPLVGDQILTGDCGEHAP